MAKSQNKTVATEADVSAYLETIADEGKRADAQVLLDLMGEVTGEAPKMWGTMIGFGTYHYKYASGREGDYYLAGFAPRKDNMTLYLMGIYDKRPDLMDKLGKYKVGKACLYVKRLSDVNMDVLRELVRVSVEQLKQSDVVVPPSE